MSDDDQKGRCMIRGFLCCYSACDCNKIEMGCRSEEDCLCIRHACCMSLNAGSLGCGLTTDENDDDEICKLGAMCCDLGLVKPKTLCSGASALCCLYEVVSIPCSENYVEECVCGWCFIQCAPKCGCCEPPPACPALEKLCSEEIKPMTMEDRGDEPAAVEAEAKVIEKGEDKEANA